MAPVDSPSIDLVEAPVLERVLHQALIRGGSFAEVFVEDRSSSSIFLDDRKVEELSSGRDRGAGIRVIVGETTGFAHTADLSEAGLLSGPRQPRQSLERAAAACVRSRYRGAHLNDKRWRLLQHRLKVNKGRTVAENR